MDDAVGLWMHFILNQLDKLNKLSTSLNLPLLIYSTVIVESLR